MNIVEAVKMTFAVIGQDANDLTVAAIAVDLEEYPVKDVLKALGRCRHELKYKMSLKDIVDRLPGGHPGPEEAWSILTTVLHNEDRSVMWTEEIRLAAAVAFDLRANLAQARLAFHEKYAQLLAEARLHRRKPVWSLSRGFDRACQADAVREAIQRGRITEAQGLGMIPPEDLTPEEAQKLLDKLDGPDGPQGLLQ